MGEGESTRTAAERFTAIANKGSKATLDDVKEAFSVEKLSKAFFDEYKKHYDIFCDFMVSKPNIRQTIFNGDEKGIRDFNKKLMGRIVFLYFIQKKGWLGVPEKSDWGKGDFDFLSNLFKNTKNPDLFYSELLSKLFFDTLNTKRKDDIIELVKGEPCRIPYLNGGLFEEDDKKHRNLIFPANLFKSLFDFFNQYNFTIYEDDPNDHTVAVDPEMLGHIFENLLEDNKDKGAYYTPKEIVHYMCQESLIEYLTTWFENKGYEVVGYIGFDKPDQPKLFSANEGRKGQLVMEADNKTTGKQIDRILIEKLLKKKLDDDDKKLIKKHSAEFHNALDSVKICDPAIGSGAFPMGLLHEIFTAKQTLHTFEHGNTKTFDASAVKLNIIQNSIYGVDIEKGAVDIARLRFWLSLIVDEEKPKALPNLDYKIVVGNSLVSKLGDAIIDIDWTLNETSHGLFGADLAKQKGDLLKKISKEQKEFFNPDSHKKKLAANIRKLKIDLLITQLELMISTKGIEKQPTGSGATIAKQTEIYLQTIGWKNSIKDLQKLKNKPELPLHFFDWKLDFPEVLNSAITDKYGFDIVIGNPPYGARFTEIDKQFFKNRFKNKDSETESYILFIELGGRLQSNKGALWYIIPSNISTNPSYNNIRKHTLENFSLKMIIDLGSNIFESASVDSCIFAFKNQKIDSSKLRCGKISSRDLAESELNLFEQKYFLTTPQNIFNFYINTETSDLIEKIQSKASNKLSDFIDFARGIEFGYSSDYVYDSKGRNRKPLIAGRCFNRYELQFDNKFVEVDFSDTSNFKTKAIYENPKIFVRRIGKEIIAYLDTENYYNVCDVYNLLPKSNKIDLYEILGIINSKGVNYFFSNFFKNAKELFPKIPIKYLKEVPIKLSKGKISKLSKNIQQRRAEGKDTTSLEQEIDNLVYKLYELTYDEVKVIDPEFSLSKKEYEAIKLE